MVLLKEHRIFYDMPDPEDHPYTNELIHESSPYLLQHAHNPVNWKAWNDQSLNEAIDNEKLLLISVGYSACHWCHVMEHESFEDPEVAAIMNKYFVNIKVDREERPDVDQVYMNAVQVMTGAGGWPMNVVALPDGRPVWGGTYFQKKQWMDALQQLANLFQKEPKQLYEYAYRLEQGLQQLDLVDLPENQKDYSQELFIPMLEKWKRFLDFTYGGSSGAPKFMMPSNLDFLMRWAFQNQNRELSNYVQVSLDKISFGGTYDPVEGGFSRYSVDARWHVPHFEKMLYDNAQLLSLYSKAYKLYQKNWYAEVVEQTASFLLSEMRSPDGCFYSAYDADSPNSEGKNEEGAYYVWTKAELKELLNEEFDLFAKFYHIDQTGHWENGNYVLYRTADSRDFAAENQLSEAAFIEKKANWLKLLRENRKKRDKPGLDDKALTSWNCMTITGLCHAYQAVQNPAFQQAALETFSWLENNMLQENGRLLHSYKNGKSSINAYLEDYAFAIEAAISLFETFSEERFLEFAERLTEIVKIDFEDAANPLFFFTSSSDRKLVSRTKELTDNVIPASNSVMTRNLFKLGKLTAKNSMVAEASEMLQCLLEKIPEYPQYYSGWLDLLMNFTHPFYEIAICGENFAEISEEIQESYIPNSILIAGDQHSSLKLLENRYQPGKNLIYLCEEGSCQRPTDSKAGVMAQIRQV